MIWPNLSQIGLRPYNHLRGQLSKSELTMGRATQHRACARAARVAARVTASVTTCRR